MDKKVRVKLHLDRDLLKALKEEAKANQCSLNNYIEKALAKDIGNIPNEATKAAIEEAKSGNLERIDNIDDWLEKL
ncbi:hypothetical protein SAMN04487907_103146 [Zunongwangia mangrovi]|uniref:HicB family protein n=1 Tax=Zunongwangia mangrovi TaxID=1334022 RepID=A0A1I1HRJ2_9FLAO|nr:hypothetical protein [Zunongwangia mangrovi]SFC26435.1 hypothetical protein SAMN04487907_103146 [Zunongwangia mangrovi]